MKINNKILKMALISLVLIVKSTNTAAMDDELRNMNSTQAKHRAMYYKDIVFKGLNELNNVFGLEGSSRKTTFSDIASVATQVTSEYKQLQTQILQLTSKQNKPLNDLEGLKGCSKCWDQKTSLLSNIGSIGMSDHQLLEEDFEAFRNQSLHDFLDGFGRKKSLELMTESPQNFS